jgi:hypothetical protein
MANGGGNEQGGVFTKYQCKALLKSNNPYLATSNSFVAHTIIGTGMNARSLLAFYQFQGSYLSGVYVVLPGDSDVKEDEVLRWT